MTGRLRAGRLAGACCTIPLLAWLGVAPGLAQSPPAAPTYLSRAVSRAEGNLRVSTVVLSDDESKAVYGVPLADQKIQPVWIEVENHDDRAYWLLWPGVDPNYFPSSEAIEAFPSGTEEDRRARERRFRELRFPNPIAPGRTVSGFVLTNRQEGAKLVQVDLWSNERFHTFSIVVAVPGLQADYQKSEAFTRNFYPPEQIVDFDDDASFRKALEALPCCVTNKAGDRNGDPLNLVVIGGVDDAFASFVRRGWSLTETKWSGSVMRMVTSAISKERYPYAPVSDLYLYGRPQDIALQESRDNIHQRNHLRLWKSPLRYHGQPVWVGQVSRDIGSRLTIHSPTLTTHKIDPNVDLAATSLLGDMFYSQNLRKFALVSGVGAATKEAPRRNLTTDPYYTSGLRAVLFFDRTPTPISAIEFLHWEPALPQARTGSVFTEETP